MSKPTLLVALSDGFALPTFFAEKLDKIIGSLPDMNAILVQDSLGIAAEYFKKRQIPTRSERASVRLDAKRVVEASTHVVVFWGGHDLTDIVYFSRLLKKNSRVIPLRITTVRNQTKEEFDVSIGRGGPWGNPFKIGHGPGGLSREEVIRKYKEYFEEEILPDQQKHAALLSLRGYRLGCFCKPEACHGDIIAAYLNSYVEKGEEDTSDNNPD
ncbi:DUF4326 domain-containing protein [Burkholderia glumae]|uniref:DUF4326 domain-containing protein n=1 Tax=Burkholderia glumae TaxID=337 RepID=UPI0018DEDDAD|nr:DUF4326 domain-containing protein [Burkholderia glumae]